MYKLSHDYDFQTKSVMYISHKPSKVCYNIMYTRDMKTLKGVSSSPIHTASPCVPAPSVPSSLSPSLRPSLTHSRAHVQTRCFDSIQSSPLSFFYPLSFQRSDKNPRFCTGRVCSGCWIQTHQRLSIKFFPKQSVSARLLLLLWVWQRKHCQLKRFDIDSTILGAL